MRSARLDRALTLRDAALRILRKKGEQSDSGGRARLTILREHPEEAEPPIQMSYRTSLEPRWALPHGLDVWAKLNGRTMKVLNLEWGDRGTIDIVSFRRGLWEAELLAMAQPGVHLRLVKG